jgi:hypothetical protein
MNLASGELEGHMPKGDRRDPSRGGWQSAANGRRATDPVQKESQEDVMQIAVDHDARSAFRILLVCAFTIAFASITFIASGVAEIVRAEIPSGWVTAGLQSR